ncbi:glycine-rich cell wall structural protein isoform X2 [Eurytemora carolleeae]|uniref:glycine-rich cell wall structural protein isoform X2 n=1 Tax=Eurytemora carolleeae TaxID=1294199 RepID=UPI000C77E654|nr:glycine-rich cell wall structural protein isoform X2 [Eurytemora carolleeae]|eukprot:XP_023332198.1 glycine-rich cell wall structural protein-like isoform X2 [Eurytemora affinis]
MGYLVVSISFCLLTSQMNAAPAPAPVPAPAPAPLFRSLLGGLLGPGGDEEDPEYDNYDEEGYGHHGGYGGYGQHGGYGGYRQHGGHGGYGQHGVHGGYGGHGGQVQYDEYDY